MSDVDDDINAMLGDDPSQDNSTMKILRAKIKADAQKMKEMEQQLQTLNAARAASVVTDALTSAGINPAYAKFYAGEADPAKVAEWIGENKELLGVSAPQGSGTQMPAGPMNVPDQAPPSISPDTQAAMQRMIGLSGIDGLPPSNYNDILGALTSASSEDDLRAAFSKYGGPAY